MTRHPHGARHALSVVLLTATLGLAALPRPAAAGSLDEAVEVAAIADLSLEELGDVVVTSVSGRPESAATAAASVYVITGEDIRRSSATTLPEALRLAPNLEVGRINATQYAISARGFNNAIGNKLLVLVDGRTVYSPLFSGVFWDQQHVMLEDIERIEVISGPGGTLWGANAVNGVINVITRSAQDTTGTRLSLLGGPDGWQVAGRQGGLLADGTAWRVQAVHRRADATVREDGAARDDGATFSQLGFRVDRAPAGRGLTVDGALYEGRGQRNNTAPDTAGWHLRGRWTGGDERSSWQLQGYLDHVQRRDGVLFDDDTRMVDLAFNHSMRFDGGRQLLWGAGHRRAVSDARPTAFVRFEPQERTLRWSHVFAQAQAELGERLTLTAGGKLESNVYTGTEWLPSLRGVFELGPNDTLWASRSRAVRAPARLDRDFFFPARPPYTITGGSTFRSEVATVSELGWRRQGPGGSQLSATAFRHRYDRLRAGGVAPTAVENRAGGAVEGLELWGSVPLARDWRLRAGWVEQRLDLFASADAGPNSVANLGNDPRRQWQLHSTATLGGVEVDTLLRHVGALPQPAVPSYTVADLRLGWPLAGGWRAAVQVRNLFDREHVEAEAGSGSRFGREVFLRLEWSAP